MSTTIESIYGSKWTIDKSSIDGDGDGPQVAIDSRASAGNRVFNVADVLNAMRAEGVLDAVEIITELPEVEVAPSSGNLYVDGLAYSDGGGWEDGSRHREAALRSLALARYCEARHAEKAAEEELEAIKVRSAEALLNTRRREVALKIGASPYYDDLIQPVRHSVDLIIALEDQLAAK